MTVKKRKHPAAAAPSCFACSSLGPQPRRAGNAANTTGYIKLISDGWDTSLAGAGTAWTIKLVASGINEDKSDDLHIVIDQFAHTAGKTSITETEVNGAKMTRTWTVNLYQVAFKECNLVVCRGPARPRPRLSPDPFARSFRAE